MATMRGCSAAVGGRLAAIDVGSNTVRALAACLLPDGTLQPFRDGHAMTALGRGIAKSGLLDPKAVAASVRFVARFLAQCGSLEAVYCVGTAATREASNTDELRAALRRESGVELEVISPAEEAALSYIGAVAMIGRTLRGKPLVVDVGGRSTEFAIRASGGMRTLSVNLGARALTEQFLASDPPSRAEVRPARIAAAKGIAEAQGLLGNAGVVVAVGGTACSAAVLAGDRWELSAFAIRRLRRRLCGLPLRERREAMAFDKERAEIICGGLIILETLAERAPGRRVVISKGGIREGLLLERSGARGFVAA